MSGRLIKRGKTLPVNHFSCREAHRLSRGGIWVMQCALRVIAGSQSWNRNRYPDFSALLLKHVTYPPHPADNFSLRIALMDAGGSHQRERPFCQSGFGGVILHHTVKALCQ